MTTATLINVFQVPPGQDEEFLSLWEQANRMLQASSGYASTRLHRAVQPNAAYRFINVAQIDSVDNWRAVVTSPEFARISAEMAKFQPVPGLFTVVREHDHVNSGD